LPKFLRSVDEIKESKKTGFFRGTQRKQIQNNKLHKEQKTELLPKNSKSSSIFRDLKQLQSDIELMMTKRMFYDFLEDYNVRNELDGLAGVLDNATGFHTFPKYRLASTDNHTKFYLKLLNEKDMELRKESHHKSLVTKGLKSHEKNFVFKYIDTHGYAFPLQRSKFYTWKEVKKHFKVSESKPLTRKDKTILSKRMNLAWKMINSELDRKKLTVKTGFDVKLIPYSQFRPD